jgi:hypothetical protein
VFWQSFERFESNFVSFRSAIEAQAEMLANLKLHIQTELGMHAAAGV